MIHYFVVVVVVLKPVGKHCRRHNFNLLYPKHSEKLEKPRILEDATLYKPGSQEGARETEDRPGRGWVTEEAALGCDLQEFRHHCSVR